MLDNTQKYGFGSLHQQHQQQQPELIFILFETSNFLINQIRKKQHKVWYVINWIGTMQNAF